jgi:hypothetical protein
VTKRNAPCVIVQELPFDAPAGHTTFDRDASGNLVGMTFGCPCGCGGHYGASFGNGPNRRWTFDGNTEKPTVTPSLGCYPAGSQSPVGPDGHFHWHGFLRSGIFEER